MSSEQSPNEQNGWDTSTQDAYEENNTLPAGMGWLLPLLLLVLATGLVLYFASAGKNDTIPGMVAGAEAEDAAATTPVVADSSQIRKPLSIRINDSTEINAFQNGIEKQLLIYLSSKDPADSISKNRWFDFDDLNFKSGSAELTDSSLHQVQNIVIILKAFPKAKIKIGGYTDKTGDDAGNMKLSQARADTVLQALIREGANPAQLTAAEGYGSAFAKAAVDAPDAEKAKDRRISINVRAK